MPEQFAIDAATAICGHVHCEWLIPKAAAIIERHTAARLARWKCVGCGAEFPFDPLAVGVKYCSKCAELQVLGGQVERLTAIVRDLRSSMFKPRYAHEREWETEEQERWRERDNAERRAEWDQETERIIAGAAKPIDE